MDHKPGLVPELGLVPALELTPGPRLALALGPGLLLVPEVAVTAVGGVVYRCA